MQHRRKTFFMAIVQAPALTFNNADTKKQFELDTQHRQKTLATP